MTLINKIYIYFIMDLKSRYRKEADDWNINIKYWPKIKMIGYAIFLISFFLIESIILFFYKKDIPEIENVENIILFSVLLLLLYENTFYFYNNQKIFFEDELKIISKEKGFRLIKLFSNFLSSTIKQFLFYILSVLLPLYLFTKEINLKNTFDYFKLSIVLFLFSLTVILISSYVQFFIHKFVLKGKINKKINIFSFTFLLIITFIIPFYAITFFFDKSLLVDVSDYFSESKLSIIISWMKFLVTDNFYFTTFFITSIGLIVSFFYIWKITLSERTLIIYSYIDNTISDNFLLFLKTKYIFLVKDIFHLLRLDGWFLKIMKRSFFAIFLLAGILIPIIEKFFGDKNYALLSVGIILSIVIYETVGDCLKSILSVDGERDHIYILKGKKKNIWSIVKEKWFIYVLISLFIGILVALLSLIYSQNILIVITTFVIVVSYGMIHGLVQISNTALYPKLNWEHSFEIGQSKKAEKMTEIFQYVISVFYFNSSVVLFAQDELILDISLLSSFIIINIIYIVTTFIFILLYKMFLTQKSIDEVFK